MELRYVKRHCCECYDCINACPTGALFITDEMHVWDKKDCRKCRACEGICINGALYLEGDCDED